MGIFENHDPINEVRRANGAAYAAVKAALLKGKQVIWGDPSQAQAQVNKFGTDAARLFRVSSKSVEVLYETTGELLQIMPDGWTYTENPDGTVTLRAP